MPDQTVMDTSRRPDRRSLRTPPTTTRSRIDVGPEGETLLEVDHVTLRFGGVVALNDVHFSINGARSSA